MLQDVVDRRGSALDAPPCMTALDLCLSCKGCARDCPTGVDMAAYKSEVLHQSYRGGVRPRTHYALGPAAAVGVDDSRAGRLGLANACLGGWPRLARCTAGVDQRRDLPEFGAPLTAVWAARPGSDRQRRRGGGAAVDCSPTTSRSEGGEAAAPVLDAAGNEVEGSPGATPAAG